MQLVSLTRGVGRLEEDGTVALLDLPYRHLADLLRDEQHFASAARAPVADLFPREAAPFGPPVAPDATIWGIGLNYWSKQRATGRAIPEHPTLFIKASAAHLGPQAPVILPRCAPECVDYEGEIAVLVGRSLFDATREVAMTAVAAVSAANDVTARDVLRRTGNPSLAKSFPGFAQVDTAFAEPEVVGPLDQIALRTTVNGEPRQADSSGGMVIDIPGLLSLLSTYVALRPGDLVLTGTPAGTGDEDGRYLRAGDTVEVVVGTLHALNSRVVNSFTAAGGTELADPVLGAW